MSASKGSTKSSGHTEPDADTNDDGCNDTEQDKEEYTQTKGQTKVNCGQQRIVAFRSLTNFSEISKATCKRGQVGTNKHSCLLSVACRDIN